MSLKTNFYYDAILMGSQGMKYKFLHLSVFAANVVCLQASRMLSFLRIHSATTFQLLSCSICGQQN